MKVERGSVFKTSRISYLSNYVIASLLIILLSLLWPVLNIDFTFLPKTGHQLFSYIVVMGFLVVIVYFFEEPAIERMIRKYVVTNSEVVKVEGLIRKRRIAIPHQNISSITVNKGIIGRLLDFGDVHVLGFKDEIKMKGIRDPEVVYRIIQNKIALKGGRAGRAAEAGERGEEQEHEEPEVKILVEEKGEKKRRKAKRRK